MKRYSCIYCFWIAVFVLSVTSSYCKPHTYTWAKGNIQISAEGTLEEPGTNDAQNNILVKEATRVAGYRTLERFLSSLPLDSTRNIGVMVKSNPEFAKNLHQWLVLHASLTHFQFTTDSTGTVKIAINAQNFAKFLSQYDKPVIVKPVVAKANPAPKSTEKSLAVDTSKTQRKLVVDTSKTTKIVSTDTSKTPKNVSADSTNITKKSSADTTKLEKPLVAADTSKETKTFAPDTSGTAKTVTSDTSTANVKKPAPEVVQKTNNNTVSVNSTVSRPPLLQPNPMAGRNRPETGRMMPPGARNMVQVEVQMDVAKDTSIPQSVRISQAEAGIRAMAKEDLYRQIKDTPVYGAVTYAQWVHSHPMYESSLKTTIDTNAIMGVPQWNKDSTHVKLNGRLELRYLLMAVRQIEHKIENENHRPMSRDTSTVKQPLPPVIQK